MPYIKAISLFAIIAFYAIHFPSTNETGIQVSHDEFLSFTVHTQPWPITVYVRLNSTDLSTVSVLLSFTCGGYVVVVRKEGRLEESGISHCIASHFYLWIELCAFSWRNLNIFITIHLWNFLFYWDRRAIILPIYSALYHPTWRKIKLEFKPWPETKTTKEATYLRLFSTTARLGERHKLHLILKETLRRCPCASQIRILFIYSSSRERTHCGRLLHVAVKRHRSRLSLCPPFPGRSASAHLLVHPESNKETRAKTQQTSQTNPFFVHWIFLR